MVSRSSATARSTSPTRRGPIKADDEGEGLNCEKNGIEWAELQVANDGLTVVVNKDNDWVDCLTVEQLKTIWEPAAEGTVTNWNQVDPSFPDEKLELFGAGTDSGTFDYFTGAIIGEEGASRTDYSATEDDNVTVTGVSGSKGGLGYFGLSYYEENTDKLKALEIDGGDGCVAPSTETVQDATYTPLSRPLFIYPTQEILGTPYGAAFVEYYLDNAHVDRRDGAVRSLDRRAAADGGRRGDGPQGRNDADDLAAPTLH